MTQVDALLDSTVLYTLVLALSLLIERFVELAKTIFDYIDYRKKGYLYWTKCAEALQKKLVRKLSMLEYAEPGNDVKLLNKYGDRSLNEAGTYKGMAFVISGDLMRVMFVRGAAKFLGMMLGVLLAYLFQIDFKQIWQEIGNATVASVAHAERQLTFTIAISGIALGLGAGPMHKLITTFERANKKRQEKKARGGDDNV
jgi:hypothetical protein